MEILDKLKEIEKQRGIQGFLPQNLPGDILETLNNYAFYFDQRYGYSNQLANRNANCLNVITVKLLGTDNVINMKISEIFEKMHIYKQKVQIEFMFRHGVIEGYKPEQTLDNIFNNNIEITGDTAKIEAYKTEKKLICSIVN